jgi:hypothetical protein
MISTCSRVFRGAFIILGKSIHKEGKTRGRLVTEATMGNHRSRQSMKYEDPMGIPENNQKALFPAAKCARRRWGKGEATVIFSRSPGLRYHLCPCRRGNQPVAIAGFFDAMAAELGCRFKGSGSDENPKFICI